jgi:RimJ/RimL family protein N-acetyltransferase
MTLPTPFEDGIVLRPLTPADAPALFIAHSDPEVQRYRRRPPHKTLAETEAYVDYTIQRAEGHAWAITESGDEALGRIALRSPYPGVGEIGILLRREAQRRGLGSKSIQLIEQYAFGPLGMHRLMADIDSENNASLSLFLRAGFEREGLMRRHWLSPHGARDVVIMAKLRD